MLVIDTAVLDKDFSIRKRDNLPSFELLHDKEEKCYEIFFNKETNKYIVLYSEEFDSQYETLGKFHSYKVAKQTIVIHYSLSKSFNLGVTK